MFYQDLPDIDEKYESIRQANQVFSQNIFFNITRNIKVGSYIKKEEIH